MSQLIHSPVACAFEGRDITIQALLPDEEAAVVSLYLNYRAGKAQKRLRMLPVDGLVLEDSYSLYSATVPGEDVCGESLYYEFCLQGITRNAYCVPIHTLPPIPPMAIGGVWHTPHKGLLVELYNPSEQDVRPLEYCLYAGEQLSETPISFTQEMNMPLAPGKRLLLCLQRETSDFSTLRTQLAHWLSNECGEEFLQDLPLALACGDQCSPNKIISLALCTRAKGEVVYKRQVLPDGAGEVGKAAGQQQDAGGESAFASAPTSMVADSLRYSTPCVLGTVPPSILPTLHTSRIYLGAGAYPVRFVTAGVLIAPPTVWVLTERHYVPYTAQLCNDGAWQASIPFGVLERLPGKLQYYITAKGRLYTTQYGSEKAPVSKRVVDNAGPTLLRIYPQEGQTVCMARELTLQADFYDTSGVNLHTSSLCVDGRNVSQYAHWSPNGVRFCPAKGFAAGEHIVELTLRDTLGNRTYRRTSFSVAALKVKKSKKKRARKHVPKTLRGATMVAKAVSAVKELFSEK